MTARSCIRPGPADPPAPLSPVPRRRGPRKGPGARMVPRDQVARRIARFLSDCPDFSLENDQDLAALFKHCTGFDAAPRWLPRLRAEVRAHMAEVSP